MAKMAKKKKYAGFKRSRDKLTISFNVEGDFYEQLSDRYYEKLEGQEVVDISWKDEYNTKGDTKLCTIVTLTSNERSDAFYLREMDANRSDDKSIPILDIPIIDIPLDKLESNA